MKRIFLVLTAIMSVLVYAKFSSTHLASLQANEKWAYRGTNFAALSSSVPGSSVQSNPSASDSAEPPAVPPVPKPDPLSKRIVEYHIQVSLDDAKKSLTGSQTLTWTNPGYKPVQELYFHLYPNAFESEKTTFMKESGGKHREDRATKGGYGHMRITSIKSSDGSSLDGRLEYVRPDDGNAHDKTLAKLTLPVPVMPGQQTTLNLDFQVQLPQVFARMGYSGDFVMAGQWFPKVAVYEPPGTRGRTDEGWVAHQYHGNSEFYANFGIYNVRIQVPGTHTVAATGFPTKPAVKNSNGTKTYQFYADDVHDFAWSASPHFVYFEEPFSTPHIPGVKIKLYLDPKHKHLKDRYFIAAKKALTRYSEWYGPYPYSTLSIVNPPEGANGAGGMEYPTLITAWGAVSDSPGIELERVIVHEIGHQYWYGIVASNEFEEAWLDEGLTSYTEDKLMEKEYGTRPNLLVESSYITTPQPLQLDSWSFKSHDIYAENVYTRAKLVLVAIERQVGEQRMDQIMKAYYERAKFRHPGSKDFQKAVEQVTGQSWQAFFDQFVYNGLMVDYSIESIRSARASEGGYEHEVTVRRLGGSYGPLVLRAQFADGTVQEQPVPHHEDTISVKLKHAHKLVWAQLDPKYEIVLENKHINNFMKSEVNEAWKIRLNVGIVRLLEMMLNAVAW